MATVANKRGSLRHMPAVYDAPRPPAAKSLAAMLAEERRRAVNYPLSRWYLRPAAGWLAARIVSTPIRAWHVTLVGLLAAFAAAALLWIRPESAPWAALLVMLAWFFDRADGQLARLRQSASSVGAWLDANVDELVDIGLHVAVASAAAQLSGTSWPWVLLTAFVAGKYLLMYGLLVDPKNTANHSGASREEDSAQWSVFARCARRLYHLPGNADVRVHLLLLALMTGWLTAELALITAYYNLRWLARYALVVRREGGLP